MLSLAADPPLNLVLQDWLGLLQLYTMVEATWHIILQDNTFIYLKPSHLKHESLAPPD